MSEQKFDSLEDFSIGGMYYKTQLTKKFKTRTLYEENDPRVIKAFIPGMIVEINIKNGSRVLEGQELILLEAMKMRNVVSAPMDGRIKRLRIKLNDQVSKNQVMIEME